jgi:hypothetical protein
MSTNEISLFEQFEQITDGPNREALFDSLRMVRSSRVRFSFMPKRLRGTGVGPAKVMGRILGIEAEDGSGHSWIVKFQPHGIVDRLGVSIREQIITLYYRDASMTSEQSRKGMILPNQYSTEVVVRGGEILMNGVKIGEVPHQRFT